MKKRKTKISKLSVLVCTVSIMLVLGMMTGCSVSEPNSAETQVDNVSSSEEPADKDTPGGELEDDSNVPVDMSQTQELEESESDNTHTFEENLSADAKEIKSIAEKFATAYFSGDMDTVQSCLTTPYEWDIEAYAGTEAIRDRKSVV